MSLRSARCRLQTLWFTATMPDFWRSLLSPPLVVMSGHVWPDQATRSEPMPSPHLDDWPGLVEFDVSACVRCGHVEAPASWRRFYGQSSPSQPARSSWSPELQAEAEAALRGWRATTAPQSISSATTPTPSARWSPQPAASSVVPSAPTGEVGS